MNPNARDFPLRLTEVCFWNGALLLFLATLCAFQFGPKDAAFQRRWFRRFHVTVLPCYAGALASRFLQWADWPEVRIAVPLLFLFVGLVAYWIGARIKSCNKCGDINFNQNPFRSNRICAKCGAPFGPKLSARDDLLE